MRVGGGLLLGERIMLLAGASLSYPTYPHGSKGTLVSSKALLRA